MSEATHRCPAAWALAGLLVPALVALEALAPVGAGIEDRNLVTLQVAAGL